MIRFLSWDFREGVTAEALAAVIGQFHGGPVYATAVDSHSDSYELVLSTEPLSSDQAQQRWEAHQVALIEDPP